MCAASLMFCLSVCLPLSLSLLFLVVHCAQIDVSAVLLRCEARVPRQDPRTRDRFLRLHAGERAFKSSVGGYGQNLMIIFPLFPHITHFARVKIMRA